MCENKDPNLPIVSNYYSINRYKKKEENIEFFNNLKSEKYYSTDIDSTNIVQVLSTLKTEEELPLFECYQCNNSFKNRRELLFHQSFDHIDLVENSTVDKDVVALASIYQTDPLKFKIKLLSNENQSDIVNRETTVKKPLIVKSQKIEVRDVTQVSKSKESNYNSLICPLCNNKKPFQFKSKNTFERHMERYHKHNANRFEKSLKNCKFCKAVFSSYDALVWHYYFCLDLCCAKKISTKNITGLNYAKPSMSFKCCMCLQNEIFSDELFKTHLTLEHDLYKTKRFPRDKRQCIYCGDFITSYNTLHAHCKSCAVDRVLQ